MKFGIGIVNLIRKRIELINKFYDWEEWKLMIARNDMIRFIDITARDSIKNL